MKFQYAPGLPGYGTQGADGDDGLLGMSIYFSEFDGDESAAISPKIAANNILTSDDTSLPGSPTRVYQTGDIFIDINGKVYEIDLSLVNKYAPTGERLNTSTIFVSGVDTSTDPVFKRYYNAYTDNDKFLVDNVFSGDVGNYTLSPASVNGIYGLGARDFGQIKFVDASINNYLPYTVWNNTTNTGAPETAIALVKEYDSNTWRLGNIDNAENVRDVSLSLDFKDVYVGGLDGTGTIHASVSGSITTNNLDLPGWLKVGGATTLESSLDVKENIYVGEDIEFAGDGSFNIFTPDENSATANLNIRTGNVTGDGNFVTGRIFINPGDGGIKNNDNGMDGGNVDVEAGTGGNGGGSMRSGGDGGLITITGGEGGNGHFSGDGGGVSIKGGSAGSGDVRAGGNVSIDGGYPNGEVRIQKDTGYDTLIGGDVDIDGALSAGATTISGNIYLKGPNSRIDIQGDSGNLGLPDGVRAHPSLRFRDDTNLGLYRPGDDIIGMALGDSNGVREIRFLNGTDGAYIRPVNCGLVIQPDVTATAGSGHKVELFGSYSNGGPGGPIKIQGGTGAGNYDGGDVDINGGDIEGTGDPGSVNIKYLKCANMHHQKVLRTSSENVVLTGNEGVIVFHHQSNDMACNLPVIGNNGVSTGATITIVKQADGKVIIGGSGKNIWVNGTNEGGEFELSASSRVSVTFMYDGDKWLLISTSD
jgi:hypothetical protein